MRATSLEDVGPVRAVELAAVQALQLVDRLPVVGAGPAGVADHLLVIPVHVPGRGCPLGHHLWAPVAIVERQEHELDDRRRRQRLLTSQRGRHRIAVELAQAQVQQRRQEPVGVVPKLRRPPERAANADTPVPRPSLRRRLGRSEERQSTWACGSRVRRAGCPPASRVADAPRSCGDSAVSGRRYYNSVQRVQRSTRPTSAQRRPDVGRSGGGPVSGRTPQSSGRAILHKSAGC